MATNGNRNGGGKGLAILEALKAAQDEMAETAIVLVGDPRAKKIVGAWMTYPAKWKANGGRIPNGEDDKWEWAWKGSHLPEEDELVKSLSEASGVPYYVAIDKWRMVKAARLVYPDGTINFFAGGILRGDVYREIPAAKGGEK